jgi:hypothetical protein
LHTGVIISGATTFLSSFFAGPPVSFYLAQCAKRRIFMIVDGHPTHKAKKVRAFVPSLNGEVSLHLLPGYSPELNPDMGLA